jgi:phosphopantothenoylcysteine decarboxylase/phosphopantothenate--cysteine ligase
MHCLVTAGATYEPLDRVRRLTNFSTGRLGAELARFLCAEGHDVDLFLGDAASWRGENHPARVHEFSTGASLLELFENHASSSIGAIFHAAAVGDFKFGKLWSEDHSELSPLGKIPTREGALLVELIPAPKILPQLRALFPRAVIAGWKYEVDGDRASAIAAGNRQIEQCLTDLCVVNGPAYGTGFGVLFAQGEFTQAQSPEELYLTLSGRLKRPTGLP